MAKKFFHDRVYNKRRTIINLVIIGICAIGIIICFIVTSNFQAESKITPEKMLNIKSKVTVEIDASYSKELFFSKIENVNLDEVDIDYGNNFNISKPGNYKVTLTIDGKKYNSTLTVVDTTKPILVTKEYTINEGQSYSANDFVRSCKDNSKEDCIISFYDNGVDEDGNKSDYSIFSTNGIYSVKIAAKDASGNLSVEESKLIINRKNGKKTNTQTNKVCKYGDDKYNTNEFVMAVNVTTNHCAVSLDLYKEAYLTNEFNKLIDNEYERVKKDFDALKLNLNLNLTISAYANAFKNIAGDGIVGYEIIISITNDKNNNIVAQYKLDANGKRVFIINQYNLNT